MCRVMTSSVSIGQYTQEFHFNNRERSQCRENKISVLVDFLNLATCHPPEPNPKPIFIKPHLLFEIKDWLHTYNTRVLSQT